MTPDRDVPVSDATNIALSAYSSVGPRLDDETVGAHAIRVAEKAAQIALTIQGDTPQLTAEEENMLVEEINGRVNLQPVDTIGDELVERPDAAIEQLTNHQQQMDFDGVMVGVSRQALDELLAYVAALSGAQQ